jgi:uncharacterized protein YlzI (FlbEa/FlbD family)
MFVELNPVSDEEPSFLVNGLFIVKITPYNIESMTKKPGDEGSLITFSNGDKLIVRETIEVIKKALPCVGLDSQPDNRFTSLKPKPI